MAHFTCLDGADAEHSATSDIYQVESSFSITKRVDGTFTFNFANSSDSPRTMNGIISIHLQFVKYI
jgi:hypothetical protein